MIVSVKPAGRYRLQVEFSDGVSKIIDLEQFLNKSTHPMVIKYRDFDLFNQVYLDETGTPCWGDNEMDINPISIENGEFDLKP